MSYAGLLSPSLMDMVQILQYTHLKVFSSSFTLAVSIYSISYQFSLDYRIDESYLWQKSIHSNNPLMSVSVKEIWIYSKCDKRCLPNLTLWWLFPINHINSYALHFFIQDSRSCSNGERDSKTYSVLFLLQCVQISLDDWCYFTVFFVNMFAV